MDNVIDFLTRVTPAAAQLASERFEQIIMSQIYLMLKRGVPAEKLIEIVNEANEQIQFEADVEAMDKVS